MFQMAAIHYMSASIVFKIPGGNHFLIKPLALAKIFVYAVSNASTRSTSHRNRSVTLALEINSGCYF